MAQPRCCSLYLQLQISQIATTDVLEFAPLEQIPDTPFRAEIRRILFRCIVCFARGGSKTLARYWYTVF